jgi:UDP-glucuronate decarboxylase
MATGTMNPVVERDLERIHATIGSTDKFRDATVVITGAAGFLGFYLTQYLVRTADALGLRRVIAMDTFQFERPRWLEQLANDASRVLDVRAFDISRDGLEAVPGASDAAFVIHAASIASPTFYRQHPVVTIDANIWGLRRLLDHYRESRTIRGLLFFSSSEIYGDPTPDAIPTSEEYRGNVSCVGPRACYDESKRFGETLCYVFAKTYGLPITIARPFNNFGPGMRLGDRRLPADLAQAVVNGRDILIHSDGTPTRTYCYVADAVTGYLSCLLHGQFDYFNIGTDRPEIAVSAFADLYAAAGREVLGYRGDIRFERSTDQEYLTDNPNRRCPVIDKARRLLGYEPLVDVGEGVRRHLEYLKYEGQN